MIMHGYGKTQTEAYQNLRRNIQYYLGFIDEPETTTTIDDIFIYVRGWNRVRFAASPERDNPDNIVFYAASICINKADISDLLIRPKKYDDSLMPHERIKYDDLKRNETINNPK